MTHRVYCSSWTTLCTALLFAVLGLSRVQAESIQIGAEDDWYPYTALRDGEIQGMSVDIVKAAFAATGTDVQLESFPYSRCMQLALRGQIVACFNTSPNPKIAEEYRLPKHPLFREAILLWARNDNTTPVTSLDQLVGKSVAVTNGYEYGAAFDNDSRLSRILVRKDLNGFLMLQRARVDYMLAFRGTALQLFEEHPELRGQFIPVMTVHRPDIYLSFSRHHPKADELLERFDQGMRLIESDGRYQQIIDTWRNKQTAAP
ncbi:polar amino acid transport system substrate-binding protein [Pseudomonas sp. TE3786]